MDRSDFGMVDGEPDIRGWDVRNTRGEKIGEVEDLIIDAQKKKARYIVLDMDDNELDLEDRKVLVPIGLAELHEKDDDVIIQVELQQLHALPDYDSDKLDDSVERQICSAFGRENKHLGRDRIAGTTNSDETNDDLYSHDYYNDDNLYKNRLHEAKPASTKQRSEYDRGLRLWERRSDGGLLSDGSDSNNQNDTTRPNKDENSWRREMKEEERLELVKNRRNNYQQRRNNESENRDSYQDNVRDFRHDDQIKRNRDEGFRDL